MITAKEALKNLNSLKKDADLFIGAVIEPGIIETMATETFIKIPLVDLWYYGAVYKKPDSLKISNTIYDDYVSLELTHEINKILADNGYKVSEEIVVYGSEYRDGRGNFVISWDEEQ